MDTLRSCPACAGFVPGALATCPHCDAAMPRRSRLARTLLSLVGAGGFAMTLMACYGAMPHRMEGPQQAGGCDYGSTDTDHDGYCPPQDCDDSSLAAFPGAEDPDLDGVDQNCDGVDGWRDPSAVAAPPPAEP